MSDTEQENLLADFDIVLQKLESLNEHFGDGSRRSVDIATDIAHAQIQLTHARWLCESQKEP